MTDKKYQVFVSSTFRDLVDERQDAIRTILDLGHIPAGMELFPASDTSQLEYIKKVIDECDYYVLIMGGRYGSLDPDGVSYTEREYDYAVDRGKVILAFPHGDPSHLTVGRSDIAPRMIENLAHFRDKVMSGRLVKTWMNSDQLSNLVTKALVRAMSDCPAIGWVRGDAVASEAILAQLNDLRRAHDKLAVENQALSSALQPRYENLANLHELIELRFTYRAGPNRRAPTTKTVSWQQVFIAIGTHVTSPKSADMVGRLVCTYIQENLSGSESLIMLDADKKLVLNQLQALGLVHTYVGNTANGGGLHEFMQITDAGKATLMGLLAVRSVSE